MAPIKAVTINQIAGRICDKEGNIYSKKVVYDILNKCMEECRESLFRGERVQLSGIGTIIPQVKAHKRPNYLPFCNRDRGDLPCTRIKITRNNAFIQKMNETLLKNMENGILGLEKLPFDKQQLTILRDSGIIPDEETEYEEE